MNYREATHTRGVTSFRGERWFALKRPQCDTNGVGEYEVTVTSEPRAQAERTKKQKREELHHGEAQTKTEHGMMVLRHGGAPLVAGDAG